MINHVMYFGLNMLKNTSHFYSEKKIVSVYWIKSNQFDFIHYTENFLLSKTQSSVTCAQYVFSFFEFHDAKTETSVSC